MKANHIKAMSMFRYIPALIAAFLLSVSCQQEKLDEPALGFEKEEVTVPAKEDSVEIFVKSNVAWEIPTLSDWFRFNVIAGKGNACITVTYDENDTFLPKDREVLIYSADGSLGASFKLNQLALGPVLSFGKETETIKNAEGKYEIEVTNNLTPAEIDITLDYGDGPQDWVSAKSMEGQKLSLTVTGNASVTSDRSVEITLTYTGVHPNKVTDRITVTQMANDITPVTIAAAKSLPAGNITENIYVDGVVVVVGHGTVKDGNDILDTHNYKLNTYVVQDNGGNSLVFASEAPLSLEINDGIKLWLLDATMGSKSEADGFSYPVISGITDNNMLERKAGQNVTIPELDIKDITDAHVNTLVTLKEVEVAIPSGYWNNAQRVQAAWTETGRTDHADCAYHPTPVRDRNGDHLDALINYWMPWSYTYKATALKLQQGSGPLTGLVVREPHERMGRISKYQIRPRNTGDIKLRENRDDGFSQVIAEWDCVLPAGHDVNATTLKMTAGTAAGATFFKSNATKFGATWRDMVNPSFSTAAIGGVEIQNGMVQANWWRQPLTAEVPVESYWIIKVPTTGITNQISVQFRGNGDGDLAPADWKIEYSLDGENWIFVGDYDLRGGMTGAFKARMFIPGYKTYNFNLPMEASGKPMVYIRMIPTSDANTGGGTGIGQAAHVRMKHVSVKCNK